MGFGGVFFLKNLFFHSLSIELTEVLLKARAELYWLLFEKILDNYQSLLK